MMSAINAAPLMARENEIKKQKDAVINAQNSR